MRRILAQWRKEVAQFSRDRLALALALLLLRVWFGAMMVTFHGWVKIVNFADLSTRFSDPYNVSRPVSLSLSIVAEFACASLIALGAGLGLFILGIVAVTLAVADANPAWWVSALLARGAAAVVVLWAARLVLRRFRVTCSTRLLAPRKPWVATTPPCSTGPRWTAGSSESGRPP